MTDVPPVSGDLLTKKLGPLPTWGWMAAGLGLVLLWRKYESDKSAKAAALNGTTTPTAGYLSGHLPSNIQPQFTQVNEQQYSTSINSGNTGSFNGPPTSAPLPPDGQFVTVTKWKKNQPAGTPSTLSGIAQQLWGNGALWVAIWNDPKNAQLKATRGTPEKVQAGDQVWVPTVAPTPITPTDNSTGNGNDTGHGGFGSHDDDDHDHRGSSRKVSGRDSSRAGRGSNSHH